MRAFTLLILSADKRAVSQPTLVPITVDSVHDDWQIASAEFGRSFRLDGRSVGDLAAHDLGVICAPLVRTHRAPSVAMEDFHSAAESVRGVHQPHGAVDMVCV